MSTEKRKATSQDSDRPSKKPATAKSVKVNHVSSPETAKPVVATTAGTLLPGKLTFSSYTKINATGTKELLLHSSDHPTIDYIALENNSVTSTDKHLRHYVAVYDPATGTLDVTDAKKMVVRPQVRQFQTDLGDAEDAGPKPSSSRAALTEAFGTKKSKRAVQSMAENRLLARGGDGDDPLSQAILNTLAGADDDQLDPHFNMRMNKPLPIPNLKAKDVEEAYALSTLVTPKHWKATLANLSISYYRGMISSDKPVKSHFRFVSNRVEYLVRAHLQQPEDLAILQHVQLLRYIELLLALHKHIMTLPPKRPLPEISRWPEKTRALFSSASQQSQLLQELLQRFFSDNMRSQHAVTLLRTTIMALTLHIPPPSLAFGENILATEPSDISLDLTLDPADGTKLFRELGAKLEPPTDVELAKWGLTKLKATRKDDNGKDVRLPKPRFAKLRLPLEFPKLSQGKSPGKRR